jgi:hypothetical protein
MNSSSVIKFSKIFFASVSLCACKSDPEPPQISDVKPPKIIVENRVADRITVNTVHMGGVRVASSAVYRVNGITHADITISIDPNLAPTRYVARSTWFNAKHEVIQQASDFSQTGDFRGFATKTLTWSAPNPYGHYVVIDFATTD